MERLGEYDNQWQSALLRPVTQRVDRVVYTRYTPAQNEGLRGSGMGKRWLVGTVHETTTTDILHLGLPPRIVSFCSLSFRSNPNLS